MIAAGSRRARVAITAFFCCAALVFATISGCASGPPERPLNLAPGDLSYLKEYMGWFMRKRMNERGLRGLSFALVDESGTLWSGGLGFADVAARLPANEDTIYPVASISKTITAAAVLRLVEGGRLDLDAPLRRALPDFRIRSRFSQPGDRGVTLRNILSHHSGLPSDYLYGFYYPTPAAVPKNLNENFLQLPRLMHAEYVSAPPGRVFAYSNLGYSLAGAAVARAAGGDRASFADFENYIRKSIFTPLAMQRSAFSTAGIAAHSPKNRARGYLDSEALPRPRLRDLAAGGLLSTAGDLGRFTTMLINEGRAAAPAGRSGARVLAKSSVREMLRIQNADTPFDASFRIGAGLFLDQREFPGETLAGHGGDLPPFHGAILFSPERRLGAVVLTNTNSSSGEMQRIAAEFVRTASLTRSGIAPFPRSGFQRQTGGPGAGDGDPCERCDFYRSVAGDYEAAFGVLRVLHPDESAARLYIEIEGSRLELIPGSRPGEFGVQYRLLGLIPIDLPALRGMRVRFPVDPLNGRRNLGIYAEDVPVSVARPVAEQRAALPPAWRERLGAYRVCNRVPGGSRYELMRNIKLSYDSETRLLKLVSIVRTIKSEPMILPLRWLNDREAVVYGLGRHQGDSLRVASQPDPATNAAAGSSSEPDSHTLWYSGFRLCRTGP